MIDKSLTNHSSGIAYSKINQREHLRLFCFPYAGAGVSIFRNWSNCLPQVIKVCPVELPGRGTRSKENLFTRLLPLVDCMAKEIRPYLDMPFAFFGHSLGALICFELTRFLRRENFVSPIHLFVSGRIAPQFPDSDPPIHQLPESEFIRELHHFNGTPESVLQNFELMKLMLPAIRADFAICETYSYAIEDPLNCPISTFGGLQDSLASRDEIVAWREQTRKRFILRMFPGDHFFLKSSQELLLQAILQDLMEYL